jgi:NADPH:quinone reductase-like Zn-dependent oxidoreductase
MLKNLGSDHIINYRETNNWGEEAKKLTPGGQGVQHVIEIGGVATIPQSLKAVKIEGIILIIGFVGGVGEESVSAFQVLMNVCTIRGVCVGSSELF